MTYDEAIQYLYGLQMFGVKLGLENMARLLEALGDPQARFPSVLIGGTNGKGSTTAFLASILKAQGYKVGLYTSPHLLDFTERILINGVPISKGEVAALTDELRRLIAQEFGHPSTASGGSLTSPHPTFFEVSTAMAFLHFAKCGVDYAVVEVGLGGRFDATNVLTPEVAVVTNVSLEHQEHLGRTLSKIAFQKAGIIKEGGRAVTAAEEPEALSVLERVAEEKGASLFKVQEHLRWTIREASLEGQVFDLFGEEASYDGLEIKLLGRHQVINAATALLAAEKLEKRPSRKAIVEGLKRAWWPGRLQIVKERPLLLLDGAHNPAGAKALATFVKEHLLPRRLILLFGVLKEKDWEGMLGELGPLASTVVLTRPESERAADPHHLMTAERYCPKIEIREGVGEALELALEIASWDDAVLVTGSLFTVAAALKALGSTELFLPPSKEL